LHPLVEYLVAAAVDNCALSAERGLAAARSCTADQARRLIADLDALAPFPDVAPCVDTTERYAVLDSIVGAAKAPSVAIQQLGPTPIAPPEAFLLKNTPSNFNATLRTTNDFFDALVDAFTTPTFAEPRSKGAAIDKQVHDYLTAIERSQLPPAEITGR
jgi:hypothetical protein